MEVREIKEKVEEIIDQNSPLLVGELLKSLEVLDGEGLTFEQIKSLYKKLIREKIYQNSRLLKKIISINLDVGSIKFRKPRE
jgi:hypothetical protein